MNKYLIVVFCVLTGCAVVVPYSECEAQNVNAQLLADWYADYGDALEENYAIHYVLRQEVSSQEMHIQAVMGGHRELVKNLPSLPEFMPEEPAQWPPVVEQGTCGLPDYTVPELSKICGRALNIRAPDAC